jgi:aspartyl-tRNA(Asn)/glutamyl-tRNA(Gln) amidotransferase subunit A
MSRPELPFDGARAIARAVAAGEASAIEIVQAHLERIERLEPRLNAFISRNPAAMDDARQEVTGALAGVPITVKDLVLTRGMRTTAGSRTFGEGLPANQDAPVIRRLRRAGAIILGKTNLHELAMGVTTENEHFGPSRNPWDPSRIPGGSSGGSAVAVAAGLGVASVGTDTRGSIRIPAACCGVTGFKPTFGLIRTEGVVPLAPTLDHLGPLTRSVEDAALLAGVMSGWPRRGTRWLQVVDSDIAPGLRLGICDWFFTDIDAAIDGPVRDALGRFERGGFRLVPVTLRGLPEAHTASGVITSAEALAFHLQRLDGNPDGIGPLVRSRLEKGRALTAVDYVHAEHARALVRAEFAAAFHRADVLVAPTLPAAPPPIGESRMVRINGAEFPILDAYTRLTAVANMVGLPALSIPCGFTPEGMPVGLQLMAPPNREDLVLAAGAWLQRETDWHSRQPFSDLAI